MHAKIFRFFALVTVLAMLLAPTGFQAEASQPAKIDQVEIAPDDSAADPALTPSHRLIVELSSPSLSEASLTNTSLRSESKMSTSNSTAQAYIQTLMAEQAAFVSALESKMPEASVANYLNENGDLVELSYQVVFNGVVIDPGKTEKNKAIRTLLSMDGVKNVYLDRPHQPLMQASLPLINAQAVWNLSGGREDAGRGVLVASMDGGIHHDALMFNGTGWSYPADFPSNGLGLTANNNGKIVASRAYFRPWDPPAPGDENPWPGLNGTEHGNHTAGTAAGNVVEADYTGITMTLSGVAPGAWLMSYRVFYWSVNGITSFYDAEGIQALEDLTMDGADVVNNSWGGGPTSIGGEFDPLDTALINAANAGVFVSMSAGNAGSLYGTTDHPSNEYISVGNSTTNSLFVDGLLDVVGGDSTVKNMPFLVAAGWGGTFTISTPFTYTYTVAANVNPANANGCAAWPAGTFTGKAAVIARGSCEFGVKALNAQNAGAAAAVIYNTTNEPFSMGGGAAGGLVTIPTLSIGLASGNAMNTWEDAHPSAQYTGTIKAFQYGNVADIMATSSSRGPGAGLVLKPDITAPGTNIISHGYGFGATGEARHLSFGQASGTSMASPHVAGAAAVLRELHPDWSNAYIKSALMSTSKYLGVWNATSGSSHAQPLDMGAGRLDLTHAADPGIILDLPSLSFGQLVQGEVVTLTVNVTSVADATETYTLSLGTVGGTYPNPVFTTGFTGFSISPTTTLTLEPGETATFDVAMDAGLLSTGDKQGYLILDGEDHHGHMPFWGRVVYVAPADVLLLDYDTNEAYGSADYTGYYTATLETLGISYDYWNVWTIGSTPSAAYMSAFDTVIIFTGDNYLVSVPSFPNRLMEYLNQGGKLIVMGQDYTSLGAYASALSTTYGMGASYLQDSVMDGGGAYNNIEAMVGAPPAWDGLQINIYQDSTDPLVDGAANQFWVDEIRPYQETDFHAILRYSGPYNILDGAVAMAHRAQPTLANPGIAYLGRSIFTSFGLEGVNNGYSNVTRTELMENFLTYLEDEPEVDIDVAASYPNSNLTIFEAIFSSNVDPMNYADNYRWDFGDGSEILDSDDLATIGHVYKFCDDYVVTVEATDAWGNIVVSTKTVEIGSCEFRRVYLPLVSKP